MDNGIGTDVSHPEAGDALASVRPSLAVEFRGLGGATATDQADDPGTRHPPQPRPAASWVPARITISRPAQARKDSFIIHRMNGAVLKTMRTDVKPG